MINTIDNQIDTPCFLKEGMTIQDHLANKSEKKNGKCKNILSLHYFIIYRSFNLTQSIQF